MKVTRARKKVNHVNRQVNRARKKANHDVGRAVEGIGTVIAHPSIVHLQLILYRNVYPACISGHKGDGGTFCW